MARWPQYPPDEGLQNVGPAHARRVVDGGAAVVPAPVGVGAGLEEDLGALQVPVHHSHVQGSLSLYIHEVHLGPFPDKEVHAVAVACGGRDPQRSAREPATAPHGLLVDAAVEEHGGGGEAVRGSVEGGRAALLPAYWHP